MNLRTSHLFILLTHTTMQPSFLSKIVYAKTDEKKFKVAIFFHSILHTHSNSINQLLEFYSFGCFRLQTFIGTHLKKVVGDKYPTAASMVLAAVRLKL